MLPSDSNDPLTLAIATPPDKSPQQRADREKREREAQIVSDKIDEGIKKDRIALKKQKNVVRVLLLGQSESGKFLTSLTQLLILTITSGKSTTLKSLRLHNVIKIIINPSFF
jgi:hypothetical protein